MRVCVVRGCTSNAQRFFEMPTKDENRLPIWLAGTGNRELLALDLTKLKRRQICEIHFEKKYFLSKKLATSAIPTLNLASEPLEIAHFPNKTPNVQAPCFDWNPKDWPTPAEAARLMPEFDIADDLQFEQDSSLQQPIFDRPSHVSQENEHEMLEAPQSSAWSILTDMIDVSSEGDGPSGESVTTNDEKPSELADSKRQSDDNLQSLASKKKKGSDIQHSFRNHQRQRKRNGKKNPFIICINKVVNSKLLCSRVPRTRMKGKWSHQVMKIQRALNYVLMNQTGPQWIEISRINR